MTDQDRFNIVFSGELARGVELAQAQANLAKLFKLNTDKVIALFSGKRVVLKRDLSLDQATQYRLAIKKAGALVELVACAAQARNSAASGGIQPASDNPSSRDPEKAMSSADPVQRETGVALTLSEPGADVLAPHERQPWEERKVDTSYLSVKEGLGDLLEVDEKRRYEQREFDLGDYHLAEPGEDVLRPQERRNLAPREVDTSSLSLAEPGRLPSQEKAKAATPDISHLSLITER